LPASTREGRIAESKARRLRGAGIYGKLNVCTAWFGAVWWRSSSWEAAPAGNDANEQDQNKATNKG
jgi:hypothetical protein